MFNFFIPISKVQKDRRIMRETDARMAKYSRRGLIFNFCAFLICLMGGRFFEENRDLTIILTAGLLLVTLVRGFLLFRFDSLYPRAPGRWRSSYFAATLVGALWWCVILISFTLKLDMRDEAPILWLYTVIFFSTTAHAFAPYQKFLAYYQLIGLVPAALSAFFVGSLDAQLYGGLLIAYYFVLTHQCRLISDNYWERLEATYALGRKAQSLEEEKRDTRASVQLNKEFMGYLNNDLQVLLAVARETFTTQANVHDLRSKQRRLQRKLNKIYTNVDDFNSVITKELVLKSSVFNIRHELQHIIADYIDEAEAAGVVVESYLSPTLPMRLKGDASRFAQVVRTMLSLCLQGLEKGFVLVEVEFLREYENAGELYITTSKTHATQKKLFSNNSDTPAPLPTANLSLAVAKGIADLMHGSIEVTEIPRQGQQIRFDGKFDVAEHVGQLDFHRNSFSGHSILLVNENPRLVDLKRQELEALGFTVVTETQYRRAQQVLANSYKVGKRIESVLFYLNSDDEGLKEFNQNLCEHPELKFTNQIVAASARQQEQFEEIGFVRSEKVYFIDKPVGLFELELTFRGVFKAYEDTLLLREPGTEEKIAPPMKIMLCSRNENAESFLQARIEGLACDISIVTTLEEIISRFSDRANIPDVALIDCDEELDIVGLVEQVRKRETKTGNDIFVPILGMSSSHDAKDIAAYELGLDDFLELGNYRHNLMAALEYWVSLKSDS